MIERLFGRSSGPPALAVKDVKEQIAKAAVRFDGQPPDMDLMRARLADRYRDAGLTPIAPEEFDSFTGGFDEETCRRLAVLVAALESEEVLKALGNSSEERPLMEQMKAAFFDLAHYTPLLTLELMRQSHLRAEELARRFIAGLGATVQGESVKASRQRLERLDYAKLLEETERAKRAAAVRMEKLHEMQDEQERTRTRRGKW